MKKNTTKLGSLCVAAAMAVSAVQAVAFTANAATEPPAFEFSIRTNADTKADRTDTVTITKDQLASGDYTFSAAGLIECEGDFPTDNFIRGVNFAWEPIDASGNSAYKYIQFTNVLAKATKCDSYEITLSDGTVLKGTYPAHCLSVVTPMTGKIDKASCNQTTLENAVDRKDNSDIIADGNGGCYFVRKNPDGVEETVTPTVKYNEETATAELSYQFYDKANGNALTDYTMTLDYYDPNLPAGTPMPGTNCIDYWLYSGSAATAWQGASSDELPYTTFDVTISSDTPDGVYYIAFNDIMLNQVSTEAYKVYDPANLKVTYDDEGNVLGHASSDQANWLKIVVGDAKDTTATTTTTTTSDTTTTTTTTETSDTTATTTATTKGDVPAATTTIPPVDGYSFVAGEYWGKPGELVVISPTVYGDTDGTVAVGFAFTIELLDNKVLGLSEYGMEGAMIGEAYPDFSDMTFNLLMMQAAGTDATSVGVKAADGSNIADLYYNIGSEDDVKAAAAALGVALQEDAEHGTYYAFPLSFDRSKTASGAYLCEAVAPDESQKDITLIDGHVNVMVEGVVDTSTTTTTTDTTTTTTTTTTGPKDTDSSTTTTTTTKSTNHGDLTPFYGDLNLDGRITVVDIIILNKAQAKKVDLNEQQTLNGDCCEDDVIDAKDLEALMKYVCEYVESLPVYA